MLILCLNHSNGFLVNKTITPQQSLQTLLLWVELFPKTYAEALIPWYLGM